MDNIATKSGRPARKKNPFTDIFTKLVGNETQQEIADKIGVSRQNIGKWLSGNTTPDIVTLCKIASAYNVSTDYLLGMTEIQSPDSNIRTICDVTGLSQKSVENLMLMKENGFNANLLFENTKLQNIIHILEELRNTLIGWLYYKNIIDKVINKDEFYDSLVKYGISSYKAVYMPSIESLSSENENQKSNDLTSYSHEHLVNSQSHDRDSDYLFGYISDIFNQIIVGDIGLPPSACDIAEEYQNKIDLTEFKLSKEFSSIIRSIAEDCESHFGKLSKVRNAFVRDRIKEKLEQVKKEFSELEEYRSTDECNPYADEIRVLQTYLDKYDENFKLKEQKGASNNGSNNPKKE